MGGSSAIPCERKTRRRSMTSPAGPTSGNSAVQPPPCPPPRAGEGNVTSPSPCPPPRAGEGNVTSPSPIQRGEVIQGRQVALEAEARDHALRGRRGHHPVALRLAGEDIRDVDFDDRLARATQGIGERQAVVRERARVDDDRIAGRALFFDPVDQLAFVVRLQAGEHELELTGTLVEQLFQVGKRLGAVDFRLAAAQRPKIWAVENEHPHIPRTSLRAIHTMASSTSQPYSARPTSRRRTQRGLPARDFLSCCIALRRSSGLTLGLRASKPARSRSVC